MKTMVKWILVLCVASLSLTCKWGKDNPGTGEKNLTALKIGYSRLRISLPVFVAKDKGLFENHGIDAELLMYETAQPMMQALVEGKIDIAGYTALPITYNGMLRSNKELYFLTTMVEDQDHRISYLLRPKTADGETPSIKSVNDLKGKKIGILPTIAYKAWLEVILRKNGLDPDKDVTVQQIAPPQQPLILQSGGVDALFTNDPAATSAIQSGVAELVSDVVDCPQYITDPFPFGSFNVSKQWADANPELFKKLTAALNEAVDFVNENPSEAKEVMKAYLSETFQPHVVYYPDARYLSTTQSSEETFKSIAAQYLEIGIIKKELDVTGLVISK
jgi:NitT/TauT family transport system substrate-binding protein